MSDKFFSTSPSSAHARVVFESLAKDYGQRYAAYRPAAAAEDEMLRYPPEAFAPPLGNFFVLQRGGRTIAAGAYMSHDDITVEAKRVWTDPEFRRQGLALRIMERLEADAAAAGYRRVYLTTGHLQPEAIGLYQRIGYRPLFDINANLEHYRSLPFEKFIGHWADRRSTTKLRPADLSAEAAAETVAAIKAEQSKRILARIAAHQLERI